MVRNISYEKWRQTDYRRTLHFLNDRRLLIGILLSSPESRVNSADFWVRFFKVNFTELSEKCCLQKVQMRRAFRHLIEFVVSVYFIIGVYNANFTYLRYLCKNQ